MKIKTVLLLVVAVALGTAASQLTKRLRSAPPAEDDRTTVLVARHDLPFGTVIREPDKLFEEKAVPKDQAPEGAVQRLADLQSRRLVKPLKAQAAATADLLAPEEPEPLAALAFEGRRAVVVPAEVTNQTFLPNTRVDVICVVQAGAAPTDSRVIAQDLPLLGLRAGQSGQQLATLGATADEAQQLREAEALGTLRLVVR